MLYGNEVEAKIKKKVKKTETRHVKRKKRRTASVSERVENKLKLTSNFDRIKVISFDVSPRVARSWILLMMIFGCFVLPWLSRDANQQLDTRDNILHFKHFVSSLSLAFYFNYDKYFFYYKQTNICPLSPLLLFVCLFACLLATLSSKDDEEKFDFKSKRESAHKLFWRKPSHCHINIQATKVDCLMNHRSVFYLRCVLKLLIVTRKPRQVLRSLLIKKMSSDKIRFPKSAVGVWNSRTRMYGPELTSFDILSQFFTKFN